jgi:hypothetical protein
MERNKTVKPICSNCKKPYHTTDFCVAPGGKMFGKSLDDAKAAQYIATGKPPRTETQGNSANVAITPTTPPTSNDVTLPASTYVPFKINRVPYILSPAPLPGTRSQANYRNHADLINFHAFIAFKDSTSLTMVNWDAYSQPVDLGGAAHAMMKLLPVTNKASNKESPFILNTGATCHISLECSDFHMLSTISPHLIRGLSSSRVYAVGLSTIDLTPGNSHWLILKNILYIPSSKVSSPHIGGSGLLPLGRRGGITR